MKKHGCSATECLDGLIKSWLGRTLSKLLINCLLRNGPKCDTADSPARRLANLLANEMRIDSPGVGFVGDSSSIGGLVFCLSLGGRHLIRIATF